MKNIVFDIIIPAYNAHNTIEKTLMSIATQTLSEHIKVTIVNDCSQKNYKNIINKYRNLLDIEEITLKTNGGPGHARQVGIDNTSAPFIVFVDADDMLYFPLSIARLFEEFQKNPGLNAVYGSTYEFSSEHGVIKYIEPNKWTMVFANMYKRQFIEENNIRFLNTSAGEDVGFNRIIKLLCAEQQETICFIPDVVYLWTDANKDNRFNSYAFIHDTSKPGYLENLIYSHLEAKKHDYMSYDVLVLDAVVNMCEVYFCYLDLKDFNPNNIPLYMHYAKRYYKEVYEQYIPDIPSEMSLQLFNERLANYILGKQYIHEDDISYWDFLDILSK